MNIINFIHNLPRTIKQLITLFIDVFLIIFSFSLAYSLSTGEIYIPHGKEILLWIAVPIPAIPIFIHMGLFRAVIEYVEFKAIWTITQAVSLYSSLLILGVIVFNISLPYTVILIHGLITLVLIAGSRILGRWIFSHERQNIFSRHPIKSKNILIYGADSFGVELARNLSLSSTMNPIAFIDDRTTLHNNIVNGLKVHPLKQVNSLVNEFHISEILLAIPSLSQKRIRDIAKKLEFAPIKLRTLPVYSELIEGKIRIDDIRDVDINDLLGRNSVQPDKDLLSANVTGKSVMITGAGGSIGSELCRQIAKLNPRVLVLFEQNEYNLFALENELISKGIACFPVLGNVINQPLVEKTCKNFAVNTIYHAAAYKHVPLVEKNPASGAINIVIGTLKIAKAAIATNVETFVLISTDKAVRPTNVMGASKRFAELILQGLHEQGRKSKSTTRFTMVRFGNVLGSSGSVVPFFYSQIKNGGPVTVTHKDIIRYFMTIPEAAQLVIQAGALGKGGDVFVLDMGEPVRILDLAKLMIQLSGFDIKNDNNPDGDIEIHITGLRPGEKLYEELLIGDNVTKTTHELIMRAEEESLPWDQLERYINELSFVGRHNDALKVRDVLIRAVKGYTPQCGIVDTLSEPDNEPVKQPERPYTTIDIIAINH